MILNLRIFEGTLELTGYCLGLEKVVKIVDPELVTMKDGRKAVKGFAEDNRSYKVFKILAADEATEAEAALGR